MEGRHHGACAKLRTEDGKNEHQPHRAARRAHHSFSSPRGRRGRSWPCRPSPPRRSRRPTSRRAHGKEITIEELFLKSVEFQILREKAFADDYDLKMSALDDLEKKINDGSYTGSDQQVEFVLEYLALEGSAHTTRENGRLMNNFPEVRRRAAEHARPRWARTQAKDALDPRPPHRRRTGGEGGSRVWPRA